MTFYLVDLLCHDITVEPEGYSYNHVNLLTFYEIKCSEEKHYIMYLFHFAKHCVFIHSSNSRLLNKN
jgi:hypothetical protein